MSKAWVLERRDLDSRESGYAPGILISSLPRVSTAVTKDDPCLEDPPVDTCCSRIDSAMSSIKRLLEESETLLEEVLWLEEASRRSLRLRSQRFLQPLPAI